MVTLLLLACATATDAPVDTGDSADSAEVGDSADAAETGDSADTGPDPANQDADGDGYTPAEGDCDDTRDSVYPGAPDYCDGIDGDCDGEAIPDGACAVAGDIGAMSSWWIESSDELQPWSIRAGDVSGDGVPDLVTLGGPEGGGESFIVVDTTPLSERPAVSTWVAPSYTDGWPAFSMPQGETLVDSTGDGIADIWVSTSAQNGFLGSLFLFPGRTDGFPTEPTRLDAGAQAWWHDDGALWGQQFMPGGVGDLTGDGRADVLVSVQSDTDEYMARVEGGAELSGEHTWSEVSRMNFDGLYGAHLFSDLDGDGLDEISLETNDGSNDAAFVSGADWSADGHAGDVYTRLRDASAAGQQVYDTLTRDRTDDIDGDGWIERCDPRLRVARLGPPRPRAHRRHPDGRRRGLDLRAYLWHEQRRGAAPVDRRHRRRRSPGLPHRLGRGGALHPAPQRGQLHHRRHRGAGGGLARGVAGRHRPRWRRTPGMAVLRQL